MPVNNLKNGMLVFATENSTETNPLINKSGFWYYDSTVNIWKPIDTDTKQWDRGNYFGSEVLYNLQASENNMDIAFKNNGSLIIGSKDFNAASPINGFRYLRNNNGVTSLAIGNYTTASFR